jgi:acyl-CoA thioesterase-1
MKILLLIAIMVSSASALADSKLVILGDSLSEGFGVAKEKSYPFLLQEKLKSAGKKWEIVNSSVSGSTSASAPSRIQWVLKSKPDAILIALGANDGLRGIKTSVTKENLEKAINAAKAAKVRVLLAGMEMPVNYGEEYRGGFRKTFASLAKEEKVPLLPFLLEGVGGKHELNQEDGIHPNEAGHRIVAEHVFQFLKGQL